MEEHPSTHDEAIAIYLKVLEHEPDHAAAHINLGTLYYNRHDFPSAEKHYRLAIQHDPRYALAYFDLGNVLDETERVQDSIAAYRTAVQLAPTYADAHYNLALALERTATTPTGACSLEDVRQDGSRWTVGRACTQPHSAHPGKR